MADRWSDERDRERRDRDWQRSERFGRGRDQDRDFGQQGFESGRYDSDREDRTFDPRGGYDDDRGYNQDRYGAQERGFGSGQSSGWGDDERQGRYGSDREQGYGGRYQSGYQGGPSYGGAQSGRWQNQNRETGARFEGPDRDRVFGERESGDNYRTGGSQSQTGGNYGGTPDYGREPGRAGRLFGGQEHGPEQFSGGEAYGQGVSYGQGRGQSFGQGQSYGAYGSQTGGQREYGRGGEHFGQPYGEEDRNRGQDYRSGGRFYGDDGRQNVYREQYGQGGREYGDVPRGYDSPQFRGGAESYGGRGTGSGYQQSWTGQQNQGERWQNRDEREHHTPNVREGRGEGGRSWWDKAKNQVASFFGDEDAQRRSEWDRQSGGYQAEGHRGRGPKGYKRSDERITEEVNQRLTDDPWVDASEIDVSVKECEVTLSGTVSDREERRRAERVVEDIWGVTHVQNNIRVQDRQKQQGYGSQGYGGDNPREGAGSVLGRGSSDTSSQNPITGTGHGFGDTMLATGDPAAAGAASLTDAGNTGQAGQSGQDQTGSTAQTGSRSSSSSITSGGSTPSSTGSSASQSGKDGRKS